MIYVNGNRRTFELQELMGKPFLYCFPVTGMNVQGMTADAEPSDGSEGRLETVTCLACGRFHFVDPTKPQAPRR